MKVLKILFLSRWLPHPADNGSKIRILNLLTSLAERHEVFLVTFTGDEPPNDTLEALAGCCSAVKIVPYREYRPSSTRSMLGLLSFQPRSLVDTFSPQMRDMVRDELVQRQHDVVIASQLDMIPYTLPVRGAPTLLEELELGHFDETPRGVGATARWRRRLTVMKLTAYLRRVLPRFSACTVVSETERALVERLVPGYRGVYVIPNSVDIPHYAGRFEDPDPHSLVYCGALTFTANFEAVEHFLNNIFPMVVREDPRVRLRVTGQTGSMLSLLPDSRRVVFTGHVGDVRPVVAGSWASIVPLRHGGGTRLKILESMALGTPVVSTSKGAEGLSVTDGENILLADDARTFATKLVQLLGSPALRERLAAGGRALVASRYDARLAGRDLCSLVERIGVNA